MGIEIKDWWADAGLWMQSAESNTPAIEVASGPLVEIVDLARSANRVEQDLLYITSPALDGELAPYQVQMLAERSDLPLVIGSPDKAAALRDRGTGPQLQFLRQAEHFGGLSWTAPYGPPPLLEAFERRRRDEALAAFLYWYWKWGA